MHNLRAPLNELKKDKTWSWTPECQAAFEKIRDNNVCSLSLSLSLPKLDIIVASDASSYGNGACILHKLPDGTRKAIAHSSRSLLPAEKQYSQIEKEALGIIFAMIKFHRYLHGSQFTLQTDHKPLLSIFGFKKNVYWYTPPTDFYVGVPYYWTTISKLSTCLLKTSVMPTGYLDLFQSIRGFNYRNVKN